MQIKRYIAVAVLIFSMATAAFCWTMTAEFAKETAEKEAAVKASPRSPDALFDLAITYAYTNKVQEGLDTLKNVSKLVSDTKTYSRQLIERYYVEVQQNPKDWRVRFRLAFAYYFGGYKKYAVTELQNVAATDPKNPWPYAYIAVIYGEDDRWNEAVASMRRAISMDSNVAAFHLALALGYSKTGNPLGAMFEGGEAMRLKAMGY
ncbi:MAG: hypothetical protein NTZ10_01725 [Candidatus Saganbacteria bacterium]|nr:hypothetical protein [Candidatus Saganbacteria bacterium]